MRRTMTLCALVGAVLPSLAMACPTDTEARAPGVVLTVRGAGPATDRGARAGVVEAVATDGYRAVFSWGELLNATAGQQALIITALDGQPLDDAEGPLALRALADLRPGPRHVRNLCGLVVRR